MSAGSKRSCRATNDSSNRSTRIKKSYCQLHCSRVHVSVEGFEQQLGEALPYLSSCMLVEAFPSHWNKYRDFTDVTMWAYSHQSVPYCYVRLENTDDLLHDLLDWSREKEGSSIVLIAIDQPCGAALYLLFRRGGRIPYVSTVQCSIVRYCIS